MAVTSDEPSELSVSEASRAIASGALSPVELVDSILGRINAIDRQLGAFAWLDPEPVREAAACAAEEIAHAGPRSRLHGIPVSVKDIYDCAGMPTRASSRLLGNRPISTTDSHVVARLHAVGAVLLGKTHTHEFAYGPTTPTTHNPWDLSCSPGGSSGGSAAAVAAGLGAASMGTDTAGSVRIPASVCGVVGLKPTYGRVSKSGVIPLSWSLDHPGILTRTVEDAAVMLGLVAGHDPDDPVSLQEPVPDYTSVFSTGIKDLRLGVPTDHYFERCEPGVAEAVWVAIDALTHSGARIRSVTVPHADVAASVGDVIMSVEAAEFHRSRIHEHPELFADDTRTKLETASMLLAVDYVKALRARAAIQSAWRATLNEFDAILSPTTPVTATVRGAEDVVHADGTVEWVGAALSRFTFGANIVGLPALSIPCGQVSGRPTALHIVGRPLDEATVLRVGHAYQQATNMAIMKPLL